MHDARSASTSNDACDDLLPVVPGDDNGSRYRERLASVHRTRIQEREPPFGIAADDRRFRALLALEVDLHEPQMAQMAHGLCDAVCVEDCVLFPERRDSCAAERNRWRESRHVWFSPIRGLCCG